MRTPPRRSEPPRARVHALESARELARDPAGTLRNVWARLETSPYVPGLAVFLAMAFLFRRLAPDVERRPIFIDEVVASLTAINPLRDVLEIVLFERGGAPLHFVLGHVALGIEPTVESLRWLSVLFALATIPVCYDLGRRLAGRAAGVTAAFVVAASSMLEVWGTMGRMYPLFAFVTAVAATLFVRAVQLRTARAALLAALAAWLLPATHPFGIVVVGVEALVALALWRGRPLRPALPVLAVLAAMAPFVIADMRLSERFGVGVNERASIAPPERAARLFENALGGFVGGYGILLVLFAGLAVVGLAALVRRNLPFAAFGAATLVAIPVLVVIVQAGRSLGEVRAHHLIFGLPFWAAFVGVGTALAVKALPRYVVPACVLAVALLAALAPANIQDPRVRFDTTEAALAQPSAWLEAELQADDVVFWHSPVSVAALPAVREATSIPRTGRPTKRLQAASFPAPGVVVTLPLGRGTKLDRERLARKLGPDVEIGAFAYWLLVRKPGPFADERSALEAAIRIVHEVRRSALVAAPALSNEVRTIKTMCGMLRKSGGRCASTFVRFPPRRSAAAAPANG